MSRRSRTGVSALFLFIGCSGDPEVTEDTDAATDVGGVSGDGSMGSNGNTSAPGSRPTGGEASTGQDTGPGSGPGTSGAPPSDPGVHNTLVTPLPGDEVTACEWDWTIRTLHYMPTANVPRRMYNASCEAGPNARMFTSLALGEDAGQGERDATSGALIVSDLDDAAGTLNAVEQRHFPECFSTHGVAVSNDCQTIGMLCRIAAGTEGFDVDALATHADADWMTQPNECGDKMNDEMWLYEWTNGDIQSEPTRSIVHKAIGSWEYGNNYLRLGDDGQTWGIAVKATVGGQDLESGCHEADAFLVMDRETQTMTSRGWSWACGTGHTTFNRLAYDPQSAKYAMLCSTDYNEAQVGGLGAFVFRMEDGAAQEFHHASIDGLKTKGGASAIVPRDGGGFLGVVVGVEGDDPPPQSYPLDPGTSIGIARWDVTGQQEGPITWVVEDPDAYLSYSTLSVLSEGRYLLGWGVMHRLADGEESGDEAYRVPWEYRVMEIDETGGPLSEVTVLEGVGWGEVDEMVSLGQGRAGWAYIPDPVLTGDAEVPACNQPSLQLSVYTSPNG